MENAREGGDPRAIGIQIGNMGDDYFVRGDARRAIECFEQSLATARQVGNRAGERGNLARLANAYSELGQTVRAIECYEQALTIAAS